MKKYVVHFVHDLIVKKIFMPDTLGLVYTWMWYIGAKLDMHVK